MYTNSTIPGFVPTLGFEPRLKASKAPLLPIRGQWYIKNFCDRTENWTPDPSPDKGAFCHWTTRPLYPQGESNPQNLASKASTYASSVTRVCVSTSRIELLCLRLQLSALPLCYEDSVRLRRFELLINAWKALVLATTLKPCTSAWNRTRVDRV